MDIKKILTDNNIEVIGNKISKADCDKAVKLLEKGLAEASVSDLEFLEVSFNKAAEEATIEFEAKLDLRKSFAEKAKEMKTLDDLHELYENLDYVNDEFKALGLDKLLWKEFKGTTKVIDLAGIDVDLSFYVSSLAKVEEVDFETDLEKMIKNLDKVEVQINVTISYSIDFSELIDDIKKSIEKTLKASDI